MVVKVLFALYAIVALSGVAATRQIHPIFPIGWTSHSYLGSQCLGVYIYQPRTQAHLAVVPCRANENHGYRVEWDLAPGDNTVVRLSGTNLCLTSGTLSNKDGTATRMSLCHPGFTSQRWYLTNDSRIAITGGKQCLDINKNGDIQTWRCADNKHEQELKTSETPPPVPARKCVDGKQEIVFPAKGANLTALEEANGGKFRFQYCSDNFDSSRKIQVFLSMQAVTVNPSGRIIDDRVIVEQVATSGSTYTLDLTVNVPGGDRQASGKFRLEVLETYESRLNSLRVTRKAIDVLV